MNVEFTALKNFSSPELKSDYAAGMSYTVRSPEEPGISELARKNRATLKALLPQWVNEGKVVLGRVQVAAGRVGGSGRVH